MGELRSTSLLSRLRALGRAVGFGAYGVSLLLSYELHHRAVASRARARLVALYRKRAVSDWLRILGIEVQTLGSEGDREGPRLIVANHQSALDIPILLSLFGGAVVSRHDVERWPLLGRLARHAETIFVDRDDPMSGMRSVRAVRSRLLAGQNVIVFPEGRTHEGAELLAFHPGVFAALRGLDVPVQPVGIVYRQAAHYVDRSFVEHLLDVAGRPRTNVVIALGEPERPPARAQDAASHFRRAVQALVSRARLPADGIEPPAATR